MYLAVKVRARHVNSWILPALFGCSFSPSVLAMVFGQQGLLLLAAFSSLPGGEAVRDAAFPDYPFETLVERAARWKLLGIFD